MTDRADLRAREYLTVLAARREVFSNTNPIAADVAFGSDYAKVTLADLEILIIQAEALVHMAPEAARIIEHSVLTQATQQS